MLHWVNETIIYSFTCLLVPMKFKVQGIVILVKINNNKGAD